MAEFNPGYGIHIRNGRIIGSETIKVEELTYDQYLALPPQQKMDGSIRIITDVSNTTNINEAPDYDTQKVYTKGDYTLFNGNFYKCISSTPVQGPFNESDWESVTIAEELKTITGSKLITSTILAGETSVTIEDSRITEDSIIDIYFKDKMLSSSAESTDGSITITIEAQETDTEVGIRIL